MRLLPIALALLLLTSRIAAADPAPPLRVDIECQESGRTKACPAFLLGFIEHNALFLSSPRSDAQVVLYYNATEVANTDRVQLRFVGDVASAPPVVEILLDLDTRTDDDAQRAQLEPAFDRGIALYVAAANPAAVTVALAAPETAAVAATSTTPWGFAASLSGYGSWTHGYKSGNAYSNIDLSRIETNSSLDLSVAGNAGLTRQPPLVLDDGTMINLDSDSYAVAVGTKDSKNLSDHWAVGFESQVAHSDPHAEDKYSYEANVGAEWDRYRSDDPRGNKLAVAYAAGWAVFKYNARNALKQRFAQFAQHTLIATASVRKDKIQYGLNLQLWAEVIHPAIRHTVSVSPYMSMQVGAHVDLDFSLSVTERALPKFEIDESDYASIIRASYAEPLSISGSVGLSFHWDRTNGQRNDRFN
jgi:hypothetical protein